MLSNECFLVIVLVSVRSPSCCWIVDWISLCCIQTRRFQRCCTQSHSCRKLLPSQTVSQSVCWIFAFARYFHQAYWQRSVCLCVLFPFYCRNCILTLLLLHPFNSLFSRTTWVNRYQKGKTSLDLNEARDDEGFVMQWHQLDYMQPICTVLLTVDI